MLFERNENLKEYIKTYPVTSLLILINIFIFAFGDTFYEIGAFYRPFIEEGNYYRFITSMFLHVGIQHIIFNMFSLFVFCSVLEKITGSITYTIIYFLSGIGGGVSVYLFSPESVVVGASGAIFGIFGAFMALIVRKNTAIDEATKRVILVLLAIDIVYTFLGSGISIAGHIGGLIFGFIGGLVLIKKS